MLKVGLVVFQDSPDSYFTWDLHDSKFMDKLKHSKT